MGGGYPCSDETGGRGGLCPCDGPAEYDELSFRLLPLCEGGYPSDDPGGRNITGLVCHCGPAGYDDSLFRCLRSPCEGGSCGEYPDSDGIGGRIWTGY